MIVALKQDPSIDKFGVVVLNGAALFLLTPAQLAFHHDKANLAQNLPPPGLTQVQWNSGQYSVLGWGDDIGDVVYLKDGSCKIKYAHKIDAGAFVESHLTLKPGEFTGSGKDITADSLTLSTADVKLVSLVNGVLVVN